MDTYEIGQSEEPSRFYESEFDDHYSDPDQFDEDDDDEYDDYYEDPDNRFKREQLLRYWKLDDPLKLSPEFLSLRNELGLALPQDREKIFQKILDYPKLTEDEKFVIEYYYYDFCGFGKSQ
jgi:hypothetical protein